MSFLDRDLCSLCGEQFSITQLCDTCRDSMSIISMKILNAVVAEATKAHDKHGLESMLYGPDDKSLRILIEEVGEIAREMNELALGNRTPEEYVTNLGNELIQVAAMAVTWRAKLERQSV